MNEKTMNGVYTNVIQTMDERLYMCINVLVCFLVNWDEYTTS